MGSHSNSSSLPLRKVAQNVQVKAREDSRSLAPSFWGVRPSLTPIPQSPQCWPCSQLPGPLLNLCQFLGFVIERVHNFAHVLNCFKGGFICFVYWRLIKYNQDTLSLVKDSVEFLV